MPYDREEAKQRARERLREREKRRAAASTSEEARPERSHRQRPASRARSARSQSQRDSVSRSRDSVSRSRSSERASRRQSPGTTTRGNRANITIPDSIREIREKINLDLLKSRRFQIVAGTVILLLLVAFIISRCSFGSDTAEHEPDNAAGSEQTQTESSATQDDENLEPKRDELVSLLGQEDADKLLKQAETNEDALWIASNPDKLAFDGTEVQYKILKLAADEPESLMYVRDFTHKYPAEKPEVDPGLAMSTSSPSEEVPDTETPHLYQWDRRWAQTVYCSTSFGLTGCGPTSLAMVYQGLEKKSDLSPYDLGVKAQESGYMQQFDGTDAGFFTEVANDIGLSCRELDPTIENLQNELSSGHVIITNLAPGYFTRYGHYFVLAGLDSKGQVIVNDPYSVVRSSKTWDPELIASESRVFYSYSI